MKYLSHCCNAPAIPDNDLPLCSRCDEPCEVREVPEPVKDAAVRIGCVAIVAGWVMLVIGSLAIGAWVITGELCEWIEQLIWGGSR